MAVIVLNVILTL